MSGDNLNQRMTTDKLTPLHLAVHHGAETICMILLKQKASPNSQDIHGMTPVHYVALRSQNMQNKNFYKIYERILENLVNFGGRFDI